MHWKQQRGEPALLCVIDGCARLQHGPRARLVPLRAGEQQCGGPVLPCVIDGLLRVAGVLLANGDERRPAKEGCGVSWAFLIWQV